MKQLLFWACSVLAALSLILTLSHCNKSSSYNKFLDPELLKIAQFTDQRITDSLLPYLTSRQPLLRLEAAMSLASVRDAKAVDALHKALLDPVAEVRSSAAYALGQILHPSSIEPLSLQLRVDTNPGAIIQILEALGKIGGGLHAASSAPEFVENAANTIFNYERSDSIGIHAIAKAAFWMHNGGWNDNRLINKLSAIYGEQPTINRRVIAFAMGRYRGDWFLDTLQANAFIHHLVSETDTVAQVAAIPVTGRIASQLSAQFLTKLLQSPTSGREQLIAACRAASKNPAVEATPLLGLLVNKSQSVAEEAFFSLQTKRLSSVQLDAVRSLQSSLPDALQPSAVRMLHKMGDTLNLPLWMTKIDGSLKPYDRLACIRVLGVSGASAIVSLERALANPDILQANAYTEAFIESHNQPDFPTDINYSKALIQLVQRSDIGITALCAAEMRASFPNASIDAGLNEMNLALISALEKLKLPKEVETANEIIKTLNVWGISPREEIKVEYNNPIDWNLVKSIPRRQRAAIHTNKGKIEIELHVEEAPGSVASFVKLCREGFYNGKSFHRVVPNFVIQGGCPRGDGMGGTDYTLRSEFRLHDYRTGSVGLASSGPDTESCQWFITHIPTPHLEGRYTLFAHVTQGMGIVDQIEVGDTIERIELLKD
jgi:cyclophilin family peptidyl-prolyl cis-trans isomerase/HEAT repeat protein